MGQGDVGRLDRERFPLNPECSNDHCGGAAPSTKQREIPISIPVRSCPVRSAGESNGGFLYGERLAAGANIGISMTSFIRT
jgi:hypothetical protein